MKRAARWQVLIIGFVLLALLVATVVMAASSLYIEHKKLLSLADGASVAAADSYTLGQLENAGGTPSAVLSGARVRNAAVDYLGRNGAFGRFSGLAVAAGTGTARTVPPPSWCSAPRSTRRWSISSSRTASGSRRVPRRGPVSAASCTARRASEPAVAAGTAPPVPGCQGWIA